MIPIKAKNLYPVVAASISKEEADVKDITSFYWKYIRKQLSDLVNPKVYIAGLGEFNIKPWKVDTTITNLTAKSTYWFNKNPDHTFHKEYDQDLQKVVQLKQLMNHDTVKKEQIKTYRIENNL